MLARRKIGLTHYQLGLPALPPTAPEPEALAADEQLTKDLHVLLMETQISSGKLVCANCGHEYVVREGVANFLLPDHLV
jgi:multifunctional methyltransferase subunit TRM112